MRQVVRSGVPFYTFEGDGTQIDLDAALGGFACGQLRATTSLKAQVDLRPPHRGGDVRLEQVIPSPPLGD